MLFLQYVLDDLGTWCCTSTARDLKTITSRFEHEGLSFLTITLSNFGADLQKGLDQGYVSDDLFAGFQRRGGLPQFLGGFLRNVFDPESGRLLDQPCITSIWAIRQLTLMFAKIKLECSDARKRKAIQGYFECEKEVKQHDQNLSADSADRFNRAARVLWFDLLSSVDQQVARGELLPNHGPGQTADSLIGNEKWNQIEWTERLDRVVSIDTALIPNPRHWRELDSVNILEPGEERPVKVVFVPKTMKTPRVIAMEPTCMQYVQQAIANALTHETYGRFHCHMLLGSRSQVPNQRLAQEGSLSGNLATLDMSEASDRVSNQHVRLLLRHHPNLFEAVDASRSRKADVFGKTIRLSKFASMGSALTFPLEAMVFTTLIFVGIGKQLNRPVTEGLVNSLIGRVRVYGDDIIVPVEFVQSVIEALEDFGLRVNSSKSYWNGKFRESCGKDYYDGVDVSVVRVRNEFPSNRANVREMISVVSLRNQLYKAGLWKTVAFLDEYIGKLIPFPRVSETASHVLGRHSFLGFDTERECPHLHRPLVKAMVVEAKSPINKLDGLGALLKFLVVSDSNYAKAWNEFDQDKHEYLPVLMPGHLERSGRPRAVNIKPRWTTPY
jgi:hypothetical protein